MIRVHNSNITFGSAQPKVEHGTEVSRFTKGVAPGFCIRLEPDIHRWFAEMNIAYKLDAVKDHNGLVNKYYVAVCSDPAQEILVKLAWGNVI